MIFPNTKIIMDHFYLAQALNRKLNKLRVGVVNKFRHIKHRLYNKYKNYWGLCMTSRENLETLYYQSLKLFDRFINTSGIDEYLLDKNPVLKVTCNILHNLTESL